MTNFENFQFMLVHAKLEVIGVKQGNAKYSWDCAIQNQLNAFSALQEIDLELEAHVIAVQESFKNQITLEEIIEILQKCLSHPIASKDVFLTILYNLCVFEVSNKET